MSTVATKVRSLDGDSNRTSGLEATSTSNRIFEATGEAMPEVCSRARVPTSPIHAIQLKSSLANIWRMLNSPVSCPPSAVPAKCRFPVNEDVI